MTKGDWESYRKSLRLKVGEQVKVEWHGSYGRARKEASGTLSAVCDDGIIIGGGLLFNYKEIYRVSSLAEMDDKEAKRESA